MRTLIIAAAILAVSALQVNAEEPMAPMHHHSDAPTPPKMTMGDGVKNHIVADGVLRDGATFTFAEVEIDGNGWLVIHRIVDGKPVGDSYLGATYIASGVTKNVALTLKDYTPAKGETFVVMMHRDVNENKTFDFIFVDPPHVLDRAVFEGSRMISHIFAAP